MAAGLTLAGGTVANMDGFADWLPNLHALVIHLPLGLLVTAGVAFVGLKRRGWV